MSKMGEATYYCKANGCTEEKITDIHSFFHEGAKAETYWQKRRDMEYTGAREKFWDGFKIRFPIVMEYLKFSKLAFGDCNNDLAGKLDFGHDDEIDNSFSLRGDTMYYSAYVWHFADWNPLGKFLEHKFGLRNFRWLSDEYINPFDLLED
jgi:hypothetical protein